MFVFATRQTLRARMLTLVAHVTSDAEASDLVPIYNEWLRQAANQVANDTRGWVEAKREHRFTMGIDQEMANYPTNCDAGNVIELGWWDGARYVTMDRAPITVGMHTDPTNEEGGAADALTRGYPIRYECGKQIRVWPAMDKEYQFKLIHSISVEMNSDNVTSVLDADLILYLALASAWDDEGNDKKKQSNVDLYKKRIMDLRGWMQAASSLVMSPTDSFSLDGIAPAYDFGVSRGTGG